MTGKFITVEGIEGVGKTTNMEYLQQLIMAAGKELVVTREPGGTPLGEAIRTLLLDPAYKGMDPDCELQLMFAARAEHLDKVIKPTIEAGRWVLCDRFTDATYAYQGGGRGLDMEKIAILEQLVQGDFRPDLTLLLDVPVEVGLARAGNRSAPDRFEQEQVEFFERVRRAYLEMAATHNDRYRVIDASQPLENVQRQLDTVIKTIL
ncbi:MAG: dTMP kinase [Gammaproteobacteria bacterium]|nr:MAG: dTMP kinase [Gammaproteobacteria bacterium]